MCLIGYVPGRDSTSYFDNNHGENLVQGTEYCYRIVAIYNGGTPGFPSVEVCDVLIPGTPAVLQASVDSLGIQGEIFISWARPLALDTLAGPFEYILYRSDLDAQGNNFNQIHSFTPSDLNDTTYLDNPVNTSCIPTPINLSYTMMHRATASLSDVRKSCPPPGWR